MANKTAVLYQRLKIDGNWTFQKVSGNRLRRLSSGAYYVSWYEGPEKRLECVGPEPDVAIAACSKKTAELQFIAAGGQVKESESDENNDRRVPVAKAVSGYIEECRDRQGKSGYGLAKTTVEAYRYRLGYFTEFKPKAYLDEVDVQFVKEFRRFLRKHPDDLSDRTCYNVMQAVSTFLIANNIVAAKPVLKEMSFPPKPVIPYKVSEMNQFFGACDQEEELIFKFFLHSMGRKREVAFCECRDLLFEKNVLHISPKPDKSFRLKGKRSGQAKYGRKVPINAAFMAKLKEHCKLKASRALVFPNGRGGIENHFLRRCKAIAKRAGLPNWKEFDLHRWRKTGATLSHESGVSVRKIQARLGHESVDETLAYLGVEDAADDYSQEQVNNGLYLPLPPPHITFQLTDRAKLQLEQNDGQPDQRFWTFHFSEKETHNRKRAFGLLLESVVPTLCEYLHLRELLVIDNDPGTLFLNRRGGSLARNELYQLVGDLTERYAGKRTCIQGVRHSIAVDYLRDHPRDYVRLAEMLWIDSATLASRFERRDGGSQGSARRHRTR